MLYVWYHDGALLMDHLFCLHPFFLCVSVEGVKETPWGKYSNAAVYRFHRLHSEALTGRQLPQRIILVQSSMTDTRDRRMCAFSAGSKISAFWCADQMNQTGCYKTELLRETILVHTLCSIIHTHTLTASIYCTESMKPLRPYRFTVHSLHGN